MEERILEKRGKRYFYRLSEADRKQHNLMFLLMLVLFVTGFPLRFQDEWWAPHLYRLVGGPSIAPTIHRFAGLALSGLFVLHLLTVIRLFLEKRMPGLRRDGLTASNIVKEMLGMEMVPNRKDLKELLHHVMYLLYLKESPPEYGRMTWREKLDYLALYRGIPVVAFTGLLLWQSDLATRLIPGILLNVAYLMHGYEVTLILLSVVGFHWYNVHYSPDKFPMSHAFITGYLSEDEILREHYGEYKDAMREAGLGEKIKERNGLVPLDDRERTGYKLLTVMLILFFVWFTALATRYIFYTPSSSLPETPGLHSSIVTQGRDKVSGCIRCHTDVPHTESNTVMEPFLNMHTAFLACETCHVKGKGIVFRWYDPATGGVVENPSAGLLVEKKKDYGARILPGSFETGNFIPLKIVTDEGTRLNRRNHRDLSKDSLSCPDCHKKEGGYLPLGELGYPSLRISEINSAEMLALIEKYRKVMEEVRK